MAESAVSQLKMNIARWLSSFGPQKTSDKSSQRKGEEHRYQQILDDQPHNPYNEVRILSGHIASVHQIARIDETRIVSASNDGTAVIWDAETGNKLCVLSGHEGPVTCLLPLQPLSESCEPYLIVTASLSGTIRIWDLSFDELYQQGLGTKVISENSGAVKCLVELSHELICSGGRDLCLWSRNGHCLSRYDRSSLEEISNIHSVLKLEGRHFGVVAASQYHTLAVFDIKKSTMTEMDRYELVFVRYLLGSHRDVVTCLTSISANLFASGSKDGTILLWSTNSLNPMKMFQCAESSPLTQSLREPMPSIMHSESEINHILALSERYLFAAVGNGFKVYDVLTYEDSQGHPKPLASNTVAHQEPITCLEFLEDRAVLLTASEDGTVRLWGNPNRLRRDNDSPPSASSDGSATQGKMCIEEFLGIEISQLRSRRRSTSIIPVTPTLLGDLLLHKNPVEVVLNLGKYGLVTSTNDGNIFIWKDGDKEREKRDLEIRSYLKGEAS